MRPVTVQIEISRAPADIWEYLVNAEHNPEWLSNMSSCRWLTDPPIRIGSRYEQHARFLGKDVMTTFEVSALEPERLVTITSLPSSSFPLTITRKLDPIDARRCLASGRRYRAAPPCHRGHAPAQRRKLSLLYRSSPARGALVHTGRSTVDEQIKRMLPVVAR